MRTLPILGPLLSAIAALCLSSPAGAVDVDFNGTVSTVCSLALSTDGTLAMSADGTTLSSEETLGSAAAVTILSIGTNNVDVGAPSRTSAAPPGYDNSQEQVEVSYSGAGGLSAVSQGYTGGTSSFSVGNIALSVLTVDARIVNPDGFAAGNYTARTVITCN